MENMFGVVRGIAARQSYFFAADKVDDTRCGGGGLCQSSSQLTALDEDARFHDKLSEM